jgi:hypothetical protein
MTTTALDALPSPQSVPCGAHCGGRQRVLASIAVLSSQAGPREQLRTCHDDGSLRATLLSARAQREAA